MGAGDWEGVFLESHRWKEKTAFIWAERMPHVQGQWEPGNELLVFLRFAGHNAIILFTSINFRNAGCPEWKKNLPPSVIPQDYIYSCHTVADPAMEWTW